MPLYIFRCDKCQVEFEVQQKITACHIFRCPNCEGKTRQLFSPPAVLFKGKGFFSTDNRPDRRVKSESGQLGYRASELDRDNIDDITPTRVDSKGRPRATPTRPTRNPIRSQT